MQLPFKASWFDSFMLILAVFPFVILFSAPVVTSYFNPISNSFWWWFWAMFFQFILLLCLSCPVATFLYFYWRFKGGHNANKKA